MLSHLLPETNPAEQTQQATTLYVSSLASLGRLNEKVSPIWAKKYIGHEASSSGDTVTVIVIREHLLQHSSATKKQTFALALSDTGYINHQLYYASCTAAIIVQMAKKHSFDLGASRPQINIHRLYTYLNVNFGIC